MAEPRIHRRELLAGGLAAGVALGTTALPKIAAAQSSDTTLLSSALVLEQNLVRVYGNAADSGVLGGPDTSLVATLAGNAGLAVSLLREQLGESAPGPVGPPPGLGRISTARGWFEVALGFQTQAYLAYLDAVAATGDSESTRLAATLGANGAQQLATLRARLGKDPVPTAFELGSPA